MPVNPKLLRRWLAAIAILLFAVVLGFYSYARYRMRALLHDIPARLNLNVQQSANGFKISKSVGGRTLFTISASKAVQFKGSARASLSDARILIFNRGQGTTGSLNDVYDQIYGKQFDYDQTTGEVTAAGNVMIDLQAKGKPAEDPGQVSSEPDPQPGAIHLRTSGLSFNQKTGIAKTDQEIDFALPQASGTATGAVYDSKQLTIQLKSKVNLHTTGSAASHGNSFGSVDIHAEEAVISDAPRQATLFRVRLVEKRQSRTVTADRVQIALRADNTVDKIVASGDVNAIAEGSTLHTSQAELIFAGGDLLKNVVLTGAVRAQSQGASPVNTQAERAVIDFSGRNLVSKIHAAGSVHMVQAMTNDAARSTQGHQPGHMELLADAVDLFLKAGNHLDKATTSGAARITVNSGPARGKAASKTTVTADKFEAAFAPGTKNQLQTVRGTGNTKIISSSAGEPDRTTTSHTLFAKFDLAGNGGITTASQEGDFKYAEGQRSASADRAKLLSADDTLTLSGSARIQDASQGLSLSAGMVKLDRRTGEVDAQGSVKSSYSPLKTNSGGAMLAGQGNDPIHVTAASMVASRSSDTAKYSGGARLWQGANLVQAPQIIFDRAHRTLEASRGTAPGSVETVFVQTDKSGKSTPVNVTAAKLTYSDSERTAKFEGGVQVRGAETTLTADHANILLKEKHVGRSTVSGSASQVDEVLAQGNIVIVQQNPSRKATGSDLIYTAGDGKFVLTGSPGKLPSIFDAERGNIEGNSLTFFSRDDRVQVGSGEATRTVTRTRLKSENKP